MNRRPCRENALFAFSLLWMWWDDTLHIMAKYRKQNCGKSANILQKKKKRSRLSLFTSINEKHPQIAAITLRNVDFILWGKKALIETQPCKKKKKQEQSDGLVWRKLLLTSFIPPAGRWEVMKINKDVSCPPQDGKWQKLGRPPTGRPSSHDSFFFMRHEKEEQLEKSWMSDSPKGTWSDLSRFQCPQTTPQNIFFCFEGSRSWTSHRYLSYAVAYKRNLSPPQCLSGLFIYLTLGQ